MCLRLVEIVILALNAFHYKTKLSHTSIGGYVDLLWWMLITVNEESLLSRGCRHEHSDFPSSLDQQVKRWMPLGHSDQQTA